MNVLKSRYAPTCSRDTWIERQALLTKVRQFFLNRAVLEVESPTLSRAGGTDPQLDYFEVVSTPSQYMMTSPEFHMKRLLAAGFGDIFQITKSFRRDEYGSHHNMEFSMVEWYRVGMSQEKLMDEVEALVSEIVGYPIKARRTRWIDAFKNYAGVDPFCRDLSNFAQTCEFHDVPVPESYCMMSREDWWDYLMVFVIEPALASNGPEFILDYPPSQAALAQTYVDKDGLTWAKRFELFVDKVELCNGYTELTDAAEQRRRFNADLEIRKKMNKPLPPIDERFLAALDAGMPACSGVALGLDRLFMLALGKKEISDVILFPNPIA
ncbi:EF-P lysine aminoacylase EpmA [Fibrobacter sp.]|uniref:EF-P lysine aminoacylase EpmA n=1 Tax=Fibrobacter sp. TaxID=35828 RepID=UPI00388E661C